MSLTFVLSTMVNNRAINAGGHSEVVIPVPIPNTEVKHLCADDTAFAGK